MTVRARLRWTLVALWAGVIFLAVLWHRPLALVLTPLVPLAWTLWRRMRLTADDDGVTVVNFFRTYRVPWIETSGFDWTFERLTVSINVLLRNGTRRHFWFAAPERSPSRWRNDPTTAVRRLRWLRSEVLGEPIPPADLDEIDEALAAAEAGDRGPVDRLIDAKRLDPNLAEALLQHSTTEPD
jgi:hypothetical protein